MVRYSGGRQTFQYTARGHLRAQTYYFGNPENQSHTIWFAYNALGLETHATYPEAGTVQTEYFANGWVKRIPGHLAEVEYDPRGFPIRIRYVSGVETRTDYTDGVGRPARQWTTAPSGTIADSRFTYDLLGSLVRDEDLLAGETISYRYDHLQQLIAAQHGNTVLEYRYAGRDLAYQGENELDLAYDDNAHAGRVTAIGPTGDQFQIPYDANGNVLALPGRRLRYDFKNQLTGVERDDGTTAQYWYDHQGRRVRKRVERNNESVDTFFLSNRVEVRDGRVTYFVALGHARVAIVTPNYTRFVHTDQTGSGRFFTDASGTRLSQIAYHPFGTLRSEAPADLRLFAFHAFDDEAGLYYLGRRHYAPEIGRFVQPDPLYLYHPDKERGEPRTLALYSYVENDPLNRIDPTGLSTESVAGAIVGVIVGIVAGILFVLACAASFGLAVLALAGIIALYTVGYLGARFTEGGGREFFRGFLLGLTIGLNTVFLAALANKAIGLGAAIVVGIVVLGLTLPAISDEAAQNEVYQGILGWLNWLMPMSWVVNGLGLLFFLMNVRAATLTAWQAQGAAITEIAADWKTGTIFLRGGWISNANAWNSAFNMGNFAFVDDESRRTIEGHQEHEAGHTLNLAAFGSVFHLIGWIDEAIDRPPAFSEMLARGNNPASRQPSLPMWN